MEGGDVASQSKIFNDPVHGLIEIHPLCIAIIDTPVFQRLRYIKQAGSAMYVYPGACHCRFEHCIGVSYLAGKFASSFKEKQHQLEIDDKDILCVKVAGLCHDLGHGPFSHTWEKFMEDAAPHKHWNHENSSIELLEYLLKDKSLLSKFVQYFGDNYERYIELIKLQICGKLESRLCYPWTMGVNNMRNKNFLFEIVANKTTGLDVDKCDYILRDQHYLGLQAAFHPDLLLNFSRVCETEDGELHICIREKSWLNVDNMCRTRWLFHRIAYQHNVVKTVDIMLSEAFLKADKYMKISGPNGFKTLTEAVDEPETFIKLTDAIFQIILHSDDERLTDSKHILQRIECRQLYGFVGKVLIDAKVANELPMKKNEFSTEIYDLVADGQQHNLDANDIIVEKLKFDYGMNDKNPVEYAYYYSKNEANIARRGTLNHHSDMTISNFQEHFLFCVCKKKCMVPFVEEAFQKWCKKKKLKPVLEFPGHFNDVNNGWGE